MGELLSTGGKAAHGDLAGAGAGAELVRAGRGFSDGERAFSAAAFCACCLSTLAPTFSTTALGPTLLANWGGMALEGPSWELARVDGSKGCFSAGAGVTSVDASVVFVPSFHSIVSGAQSSSSSSISAHLASLPSPSACSREVRWMPYCCLSSSSVRCLVDG